MYNNLLRCLARTGARHAHHGGVKHQQGRCCAPACRRFLTTGSSQEDGPTAAAGSADLAAHRLKKALGDAARKLRQQGQPTLSEVPRDKTQPPQEIAVIGAGLTGLTAAWHLTRALREAKITIIERNPRVGGWIQTDRARVRTPDGKEGTVLFERAARMVKPQATTSAPVPRWDDLVFFDLVSKLKLTDKLVSSPKGEESVAGFLYYPDHLVGIPSASISLKDPLGAVRSIGNLIKTLTEPVFRDLLPALPNILRTRNNRYQKDMFAGRRDMSVGEYYAYRFGGRGLVDKVMSAMIHGITGGDIYKQSMASGFFADQLVPVDDQPITNAPVRTADYEMMREMIKDRDTFDLASQHLRSNALWFRDGFGTLPDAIANALLENPNVTISIADPVELVKYNSDLDKVDIQSGTEREIWRRFDKVVSTVFAPHLARRTGDQLPTLKRPGAVTIMLVNIWYPVPQANFPHNGFGYLLPQAVPFEQNPECVLGVIFDSDREYPLPTSSNPTPAPRGADFQQGTKLTVMMGGHYWSTLPHDFLPSKDEAEKMALAAVQRHLNLPAELTAQAHATASFLPHCLPQHMVGHGKRMAKAHAELEWGFKGRLAVAGQSYQSPGVLGSLRAGRDIAMHISREHLKHRPGYQPARNGGEEAEEWTVGDTGLERFVRRPKYLSMERQMLPLRYGSGAYMDEKGVIQPEVKGLGS